MKGGKPVFLSYARLTSGSAARALHRELGDALCFLDVEDIDLGDRFPQRLSNALLGAKVIVAFVDAAYFTRWYCLREWMLALAPWRSAIEKRVKSADDALGHLVIVLSSDLSGADLLRLPPPVQRMNWTNPADAKGIAGLVRRMLGTRRATLRKKIEKFKVPAWSRDLLASDTVLSFPPLRLTQPQNLENIAPSIGDRFVGRANELWGLHDLLSTVRYGTCEAEARACALSGIGGCGKTRIAIEYARRFGPAHYRGGVFWLNAADYSMLPRQFRSMLGALGEPFDDAPGREEELRDQLAGALVRQSARGPILYVVDNLPESRPGEDVRPLQCYCPALGHVSCLITSRVVQGYGSVVQPLAVNVLDRWGARLLLSQGTDSGAQALGAEDWDEIALWCGRLPLALEVLNGVLVTGAATPSALLQQARQRADHIAPTLSDYEAQLRRNVSPDLVPSIREAFEFSYVRLDRPAQGIARYLAWLAPAPVPLRFIGVTQIINNAVGMLVARSLLRRVRSRQEAIEMHPVLASVVRSAHGTHDEERMVFRSLAEHFAKLPDAEHDSESRQLMLDLLVHLRWHAARWREVRADAPLDRSDLDLITNHVLPALHGLSNSVDSDAPVRAILDLCDLLEAWHPQEVGPIHGHRGKALADLAEWDAGADRLEQAREFTEKALAAYDRQDEPLQWAQVQDSLGMVLFRLGERAGATATGKSRLRASQIAFKAALEVYTRNDHRVPWARVHNHLGMALTRLSELEESTDQRIALRTEAIAEHGYALSAYKDDEPDSRAVTLSNRGTALLRLAESTSQPDDFARAVADFRAALKIDTKDRRPLRWGGNSVNLAVALTGLANHLPGHDRAVLLAEAATLLLRSQEIVTREKQPLFWAIVQTNLGRIRAKQADHSKRARFRSEAATAFRAALEILSEREHPREWEIARDELNAVLRDGKGQWSDPRRKRK